MTNLSKVTALKQDQEESAVEQEHVGQLEIGTGNGNILVEGEDGETYMVVWEQDSNMQELLVQGDVEGSGTRTLLIDPSSLQGSGTDLENFFQMAMNGQIVHAAAAAANTSSSVATTATASTTDPPPQNEQSNAT